MGSLAFKFTFIVGLQNKFFVNTVKWLSLSDTIESMNERDTNLVNKMWNFATHMRSISQIVKEIEPHKEIFSNFVLRNLKKDSTKFRNFFSESCSNI